MTSIAASRGDQRADGDITVGHIEMQFVAAPPFRLSVVSLLATQIAGGGDVPQHLFHGCGL